MNLANVQTTSIAHIMVPKSRASALQPTVVASSPAARVTSAAHIAVPTIATPQVAPDLPSSTGGEAMPRPIGLARNASEADVNAYFAGLRRLMKACGADASKTDQLVVVLKALISDGIDTEGRLIGIASRLGFYRGHIVATLKDSAGTDPSQHLWRPSADSRYELHS
jgi:hypothetical protein